ncbi:mitochondrial metalloendopeptidase OMA1-like isoform X1 [Daucus carota subsp. sativus]|uniref:mitochondrial metalloendopeptidase OMA1-like isoform X1 n=2 Tax=Daucus carota subsp. sativus TaxID=79200 RepID=UPI003083D36A
MGLLRLCNHSVRFSSVLRFPCYPPTVTSLQRVTNLARVKICDGPENLLSGFELDQKFYNPLRHFVGTRQYSVHRLLGSGFDQELRKPSRHFVGTRYYSVSKIQKYVYRPLMKCLSYVTFFTGKFEITPYTNITLYVFPFVDKIYGEKIFSSWKQACGRGLRLPPTDPQCIRVESIAAKILEALQRETGRRHVLADQQWIKDDVDGKVKLVKRSERIEESTNVHLKEGINWEVFVIDHPIINAGAQEIGANMGKIVLFTGLFHVYKRDDELAIIIAHEVGHVISRHIQRRHLWLPFKKIYHRVINGYDSEMHYYLRYEHEADYIAMLLSASAGYDPRFAPTALSNPDECLDLKFVKYNQLPFSKLENSERIEFMTKPEVMQEAVRIYQEKTKGQCADQEYLAEKK